MRLLPDQLVDGAHTTVRAVRANSPDQDAKMRRLRIVGVPYTDEDIAGAKKALEGKTELDTLIAYLQGLGIHVSGAR